MKLQLHSDCHAWLEWKPLQPLKYTVIGVHVDYILILCRELNYRGLLADNKRTTMK